MWRTHAVGKRPKTQQPLVILAFPGIGNVGKITVDVLIEACDAKPFLDILTDDLPAAAYVTEDELVELPKVTFFHVPKASLERLRKQGAIQKGDGKGKPGVNKKTGKGASLAMEKSRPASSVHASKKSRLVTRGSPAKRAGKHMRAAAQMRTFEDIIIVTGDAQPEDDAAVYRFCTRLVEEIKTYDPVAILTLGGIGLEEQPDQPILYATGTDTDTIAWLGQGCAHETYGVVGPIVGAAGVVLGLAPLHGLRGCAVLGESGTSVAAIPTVRTVLEHVLRLLSVPAGLKRVEKIIADLEALFLGKRKKDRSVKGKRSMRVLGSDVNYIG